MKRRSKIARVTQQEKNTAAKVVEAKKFLPQATKQEPGAHYAFHNRRSVKLNDKIHMLDVLVLNWLRSIKSLNYNTDAAFRNLRESFYDSVPHHGWLFLFEGLCIQHETEGKKDRDYSHRWMSADYIPQFVTLAENAFIEYDVEQEISIPEDFKVFKDLLDLTDDELYVLYLAKLRYNNVSEEINAVRSLARGDIDESNVPAIIGMSSARFQTVVKGFLFQSGMLTNATGVLPEINGQFQTIVLMEKPSQEKIADILFPQNLKTDLSLDLYPHIAVETKRLTAIITSTMREREEGVNVLLWGPPGGGKTEYVLALCAANGWRYIAIGDYSVKSDQEKSRSDRLVSLRLAIKLYGREPNTVLLFDEMEDLFKFDMSAAFSKAFFNRIIETSLAPIIWTTNDINTMGGAARRRMIFNIHFKTPPMSTRKLIWEHYSNKRDLALAPATIDDLATTYDISPSAIANSVRIAKISRVEEHEVPEIIQSIDTLMRGGEKRRFGVTTKKDTPYDLSWVNASHPLDNLTKRLTECEPNFSACFYGPAGTGKSEYLRYIAKMRGQRVLFKRASDLESKWVGETEKNIARAFDDAREEGWFLIIDEGDTFLEDRRRAQQSWEKSKVNEILSQMEMIEQPFGITTNLMDNLDPAAMRRFTFKVRFDYLLPAQAAAIFKAYFGVEAPSRIMSNDMITPGDIAAAHHNCKILRIEGSESFYEQVEAETNLKQGSKRIGFHVA